MIRPAALVIGFGLTLLAGKAANIVSGLGLKPTASSVGVLQLLPDRATARAGGFSLSSSPASATVDAGCSVGAGDGDRPSRTPRCIPTPASVGHGASLCENAGAVSPKTGSPDRLLSAIIAVESGGDPLAEGDYEDPVRKLRPRAIGLLQIHKILVDDCARLAPGEHFTYADRLDPERSRRMFRVYQQHYNPTGDIERGARIWVGGPDGWKQDSTLPYLARVRKAMEEQR